MAYRILHDGQVLAEEGDAAAARAAYASHPEALIWRFANQSLWAEVLGEVQSEVRGPLRFWCSRSGHSTGG